MNFLFNPEQLQRLAAYCTAQAKPVDDRGNYDYPAVIFEIDPECKSAKYILESWGKKEASPGDFIWADVGISSYEHLQDKPTEKLRISLWDRSKRLPSGSYPEHEIVQITCGGNSYVNQRHAGKFPEAKMSDFKFSPVCKWEEQKQQELLDRYHAEIVTLPPSAFLVPRGAGKTGWRDGKRL